MNLRDAKMLLSAWEESPPPFLSLARIAAMLESFFGIKQRGAQPAPRPDDMAEAMQAIGTGGDAHAGLREPVVLDFAALKARHAG